MKMLKQHPYIIALIVWVFLIGLYAYLKKDGASILELIIPMCVPTFIIVLQEVRLNRLVEKKDKPDISLELLGKGGGITLVATNKGGAAIDINVTSNSLKLFQSYPELAFGDKESLGTIPKSASLNKLQLVCVVSSGRFVQIKNYELNEDKRTYKVTFEKYKLV